MLMLVKVILGFLGFEDVSDMRKDGVAQSLTEFVLPSCGNVMLAGLNFPVYTY